MANRSDASARGGKGGINVLLIIGILAVVGLVVTIFMGSREFATAGVTLPVVVPFLWAMFVGVVFSTIGAAGGILSGVGHLSVYGMQNANDVKPMNQVLTLVSPFFSVPTYLRQKRLVLQLGILLGIGSIAGSLLGSWFSSNVLSTLESYKPVFGAITLFVAFRALYETTNRYRRHKQELTAASARFEAAARSANAADRREGVQTIEMKPSRIRISFFGEEFGFNPLWPVLAGVVIFFISSMLGVGGGFLLVPFMATILGMPMFIVAGTSLFAIIIGSFVSIGSYLNLGSQLDVPLLTIQVVGIIIGSMAGPLVSKYFKERWLRLALGVILLYVGIGYLFGGFIESITGVKII
ncbi:Sulfite exporter TauE/SafE [Rubrobacter radiotolerans]|uniref:Probable membrane transporter protein n=1 Tax=Rubrobacter radiotolerans TaxID=42256 RepID=A0A023X5F8_RUBRA|nr:sulfite exporter TauE/SafE family protein [Rubrobacter radiotolerans]AHY47309.1 Sulfite exporter TauE/SafE [Rubrobacter radiotolerans]MDX5894713.1 sulfite exporter TauE/SafE family protein [Rubrobacter radiotolerans]SMC06587.1 hypothetical protein SAMN00767673_2028 [Rubrobacter radiotolerans DSM 5868]